jgi:hypothetical protein
MPSDTSERDEIELRLTSSGQSPNDSASLQDSIDEQNARRQPLDRAVVTALMNAAPVGHQAIVRGFAAADVQWIEG